MDDIDPLTSQQKIFLQRLLAHHVLNDKQAKKLYNDILEAHQNQGNGLGSDVKDTFRRINQSLKPAFRLEIKSVAMSLSLPKDENEEYGEGAGDNDEMENGNARNDSKPKSILYHSIVNCDNDDVAKTTANPTFTKSPHELAYFRLVLEKFMERDVAVSSNSTTSSNTRGKGCTACVSRMDLINLRLELSGLHKDKLSISQAESTLNFLETQGWLVPALPTDKDGGDNDDGTDEDAPPKRRRTSRKTASSNSNRKGASKYLQIGPRSYLEFPNHLIKSGLEDDKLPQFLLHG